MELINDLVSDKHILYKNLELKYLYIMYAQTAKENNDMIKYRFYCKLIERKKSEISKYIDGIKPLKKYLKLFLSN